MQEFIKKSGQNRPLSSASHNNPPSATLIISNNEIDDIIKVIKSLEDSDLLLKGVTETVQNEINEQKGGFLSMLLGTLGASLLGNLLTGRGVNKKRKGAIAESEEAKSKSQGRGIIRAGEGATRQGQGIVRAGFGNKKGQKDNKTDF